MDKLSKVEHTVTVANEQTEKTYAAIRASVIAAQKQVQSKELE